MKKIQNETKEERRKRILTEPLLPLILRMGIPTMIGMLISMIYNLTDTFWIGQLNSKSMTAAIGVTFSFVSLIQAFGFWFGYGSGNVMSKELGAQNEKEAQVIASDGVVLSLGVGTLMLLVLFPLVKPLAVFLGGGVTEELLKYTVEYLRIMLISVPASLFSTTIYNQFRLCGNIKDAMIGFILGIAANMILDPILILGFGMGIGGAGIATLIGQVLSCIYFWFCSYRHGNVPVRIHPANFGEKRLFQIMAGGAPNFTRQGITSIATVALNQAAAGYGETAIAALTISSRIISLVVMLMIGFGQGFQPICAMNYGAHQYDRVRKSFRMTIGIGTGMLIVSSILLFLFAPQFSALLTNNIEVSEKAAWILRLQCISLPFLASYAVSSMYMQNMGNYMRSLIISVSRQSIFYVPALIIMTYVLQEKGLYLAQPVADLASFALAVTVIWKYEREAYGRTGKEIQMQKICEM